MTEEQNKEQKEVKKITLGLVLGWGIGVLVLMSGVTLLFSYPLTGVLMLVLAFILLPPANKFIADRFKFSISAGLKIVLVIILFVVIGATMSDHSERIESTRTESNITESAQIQPKKIYQLNDSIFSKNMEIIITLAEERFSVGSGFFREEPSEGGTLVAVQWQYKNTSNKPIGMFSQPSIRMEDAKGVQYRSDIGKSISFATELDIDRKIISDLNPGITVKDADVFEIGKEAYSKSEWFIVVKADGQEYRVTVK